MLTSVVIKNIGGGTGYLQQIIIRDNCFGSVVHEFKRTEPNRYGYALFYLFRLYYRKGLNPIPSMAKALSIFYDEGCDCYTIIRNTDIFIKERMSDARIFAKYKLLMERYYIPYKIGQKNHNNIK